jgi:Tfp pilus assembly protein PilF
MKKFPYHKMLKGVWLSVALEIVGGNWPLYSLTKSTALAAPQVKSNAAAVQSLIATAKSEFTKGNYDSAHDKLKKYLRVVPNDYNAWALFGASLYHMGQPRRGQKTLQRIEKFSSEKSFVYYYQGLCFSVLGMESTAQKYWEYSGWFPDEYGAKSTIELAVSNYKVKELAKAKFLASSYLQRFPSGANRQLATDLLKSINNGTPIENLAVGERPDPEESVYKYNSWSLFPKPHFWYVKLGAVNDLNSGFEPSEFSGITSRENEQSAVLVDAAIGLGPVRQKFATAFAGYAYKQRWNIEADGFNNWLSNPFDLELFPLRGDLMERTHQLFGDVRRQFGDNFYTGLYSRIDFKRVGSSFFPSPDESSLRIVVNMTDTQLFVPWVGWSWNDEQRSQLYLLFKKEIHNNSPDHSNKTWDLTGSTGNRAISLGLSHAIEIPVWRLSGGAEIFQHEFIFNDFWLDYTRKGGLVTLDYNIWKSLNTFLYFGMYNDNYKLPRLKQKECNFTGGTPTTTAEDTVNSCPRTDSGTLMQLGLYWNYSSNLRLSGSYQIVENSSIMKEYSETTNSIKFDATWAFPGVRRVSRMTERFIDPPFIKDAEQ